MKWLADENFPEPSYRFLVANNFDIIHASKLFPSAIDELVVDAARNEGRVLLTFDRDFGKLLFLRKLAPPIGVVYFRLLDYLPECPGQLLVEMLRDGFDPIGYFTTVRDIGLRQRPL